LNSLLKAKNKAYAITISACLSKVFDSFTFLIKLKPHFHQNLQHLLEFY
jgi:hypothetical protein